PPTAVARLRQAWNGPARALENRGRFIEADVGTEQLGLHRMLCLVVGERAGEGESAGLGPRVAPAREVEIDEVRASEGRVALDDEDWMSTDHDRQRDAGLVCDGRRPESRRVDDHWCVDAFARRGVDAGDAARRATNRHHLDTLLDAHA